MSTITEKELPQESLRNISDYDQEIPYLFILVTYENEFGRPMNDMWTCHYDFDQICHRLIGLASVGHKVMIRFSSKVTKYSVESDYSIGVLRNGRIGLQYYELDWYDDHLKFTDALEYHRSNSSVMQQGIYNVHEKCVHFNRTQKTLCKLTRKIRCNSILSNGCVDMQMESYGIKQCSCLVDEEENHDCITRSSLDQCDPELKHYLLCEISGEISCQRCVVFCRQTRENKTFDRLTIISIS